MRAGPAYRRGPALVRARERRRTSESISTASGWDAVARHAGRRSGRSTGGSVRPGPGIDRGQSSHTGTLVVLRRWLSNSSSPLLVRAIGTYRKLDLSGPPREAPRRAVPKRAVRLNDSQLSRLVAGYQAGATVYELAAAFGVNRRTIALHLRRRGAVSPRFRSPTAATVEEMVRLYSTGLSLAKVGVVVGCDAGTVMKYVRQRGVQTRDTHRRPRPGRTSREG